MKPSPGERLTWDELWLDVADVIRRRALCVRDQVGAVIVNVDNRIVSTGYNGPPGGFKHDDRPCIDWCTRAVTSPLDITKASDAVPTEITNLDPCYRDCPSLHAEANALSVCDRSAREGGTIYVTSHVCMGCAKLVANSGLHRIVVRPSKNAAHRSPHDSYRLMYDCGIAITIEGRMFTYG